MIESIKGLKPKEYISEAMIDETIAAWVLTRKEKNPIKDNLLPVLKRLMFELIIPSMDVDRNFPDQDEILGKRETAQRKLYLEITKEVSGQARGVFYRTAKSLSRELADSIVELHRNDDFRNHKAHVKGDPVHTDPTRGVSGVKARSYAEFDPEAHRKGLGYVQSAPKD